MTHKGFSDKEYGEFQALNASSEKLREEIIRIEGETGAIAARVLARNGRDYVYWIGSNPFVITISDKGNLTFQRPENVDSLTAPVETPSPAAAVAPLPATVSPAQQVFTSASDAPKRKGRGLAIDWPSDERMRELASKHTTAEIVSILSEENGVELLKTTVATRLCYLGIKAVPGKRGRAFGYNVRYQWPSDDALKELYAKYSVNEISEMLNIPRTSISNRLWERGISKPRLGQVADSSAPGPEAFTEDDDEDDEVIIAPKPLKPTQPPVQIGQMRDVQDSVPQVRALDSSGETLHSWRTGAWSCRMLLRGDMAVLRVNLPEGVIKETAFEALELVEGVTAVRSSSQSEDMYAEFSSTSNDRRNRGTVKLVALGAGEHQNSIGFECYSVGQRWTFNLSRTDLFIASAAITKRAQKAS